MTVNQFQAAVAFDILVEAIVRGLIEGHFFRDRAPRAGHHAGRIDRGQELHVLFVKRAPFEKEVFLDRIGLRIVGLKPPLLGHIRRGLQLQNPTRREQGVHDPLVGINQSPGRRGRLIFAGRGVIRSAHENPAI